MVLGYVGELVYTAHNLIILIYETYAYCIYCIFSRTTDYIVCILCLILCMKF